MKVDVLLACGSFWPREGGAERQLRQVLSWCGQHGLSCAVVTQAIIGQPRRAELDGIAIVRVGSTFLFRTFPRLGKLVWGAAATWRVLVMRPRTTVTLQLGMASTVVALVRRVIRARQIVRLTGGGSAMFRSEPFARHSTRIGRALVRVIAHGDVLLVSPAKHLLDDFAEAFPQRRIDTQVIPNGVDEVAPGRLAADSSRTGVVWYARGGSAKSTESFTRIVRECPDLTFIAIGHTDSLPEIASLRRLGWVTDPAEVMAGARVMLNTSLTEGMPNTALQALATGMAVVGPPNRGLSELAEAFPDRVTLVELSDSLATADALRQVHAAPLRKPASVLSSIDVAKIWERLLVQTLKR